MKIRTDFVTNSSSVSYVISMSAEMADFIRLKSHDFLDSAKNNRIYKLLSEDILLNGEKVTMYDKELYTKKYDFSKKPDCKYDTSFGVAIDELDFSALEDKELWAYIYGEYFVNGRLSEELRGFGSVLVPRDLEILNLKKRCVVVGCDKCENRDTSNCVKNIINARKEAAAK